MKTIVLDKKEIDAIDLSPLDKYVEWNKHNFQYFNLEAGKEHYKLLAYFSKVLTCKKLVDIGTYLGFSSVALSYDTEKHVESYDIFNWLPDDDTVTAESRENVTLNVGDYMSDFNDIIKDTDFILIDIDHTGATEKEIMNILRDVGYKGLVMLDDIGLNEDMKKFWDEIPEKKIDISSVGHWSRTGLVIFDPSKFDVDVV